MLQVIHVAVAVITDQRGRVLITRRHEGAHQGGLWEFPGGKVRPEETVFKALKREIEEEVGLTFSRAQPLIKINHNYPDKQVLLDVWSVNEFEGSASGRENQLWQWVEKSRLVDFAFPAANGPIITSVKLPDYYLITPEPGDDLLLFMRQLEKSLQSNIQLLQLRAKTISSAQYKSLAADILPMCQEYGVKLILNAEPAVLDHVNADGLHLSSDRLMRLMERPVPGDIWLSASCHNEREIMQAELVHADFIVLAPVMKTATHAMHTDVQPMGWNQFEKLVNSTRLPVYALGGMQPSHLSRSRQLGGRGIAAIRSLWNTTV